MAIFYLRNGLDICEPIAWVEHSHILNSYDTFRLYFVNNLVKLGVITRDHIVLITNDDWKYANIVQWYKHCPYNNSARVIPRLNYVIYRTGNDQGLWWCYINHPRYIMSANAFHHMESPFGIWDTNLSFFAYVLSFQIASQNIPFI